MSTTEGLMRAIGLLNLHRKPTIRAIWRDNDDAQDIYRFETLSGEKGFIDLDTLQIIQIPRAEPPFTGTVSGYSVNIETWPEFNSQGVSNG